MIKLGSSELNLLQGSASALSHFALMGSIAWVCCGADLLILTPCSDSASYASLVGKSTREIQG
jgi:hypothetical protein